MNTPPRRYIDGFDIAEMDSRDEWGDSAGDYLIKTLFVKAEESEVPGVWLLLAFIDVEVFGDGDGDDFVDGDDFAEPGIEVYRLPFPFDLRTRKTILRHLRDNPGFHQA